MVFNFLLLISNIEGFKKQTKVFMSTAVHSLFLYTFTSHCTPAVFILESFPTFLYGFLKPKGRGYCFLSGFPQFSFTETVRGFVSVKKWKFHSKAVQLTENNKEENSEDFCLDFVQEFGLRIIYTFIFHVDSHHLAICTFRHLSLLVPSAGSFDTRHGVLR